MSEDRLVSVEQEQGLVRAPRNPEEIAHRRARRRHRRLLAAAPRKRRRRRIRALLVMLAVAATLSVPIALWAQYQKVYVVSRNAMVKGSITQVGAQLQGVVKSVEVQVGDRVEKGQILARFEDHQLRANVLRAESRRAESSARIAAAQARIAAAHSQTEEMRARYQQTKTLTDMGAIPKNELRTSDTRLQTSQALEMTAHADQKAAEAEAGAANAEIALAKADLEASVIRAPADGWVLQRLAEPGTAVRVGEPVVAVWIGRDLWVDAWIEEHELSQIKVGNEARVIVKSRGKQPLTGVVETIGVTTDFELPDVSVPRPRAERMRTTPVVCAKIRLKDTQGLFPGLSAEVGIRKNGAPAAKDGAQAAKDGAQTAKNAVQATKNGAEAGRISAK
jgi:multidrug resistance efflux pump